MFMSEFYRYPNWGLTALVMVTALCIVCLLYTSMQDLWAAYQKKFSYASDLGWDTVMAAVRQLFARCEDTV